MKSTEIQYVTRRVLIGTSKAASNFSLLKLYGVTHIINTTKEIPNYFPTKFTYLQLHLIDSDEDIIKVLSSSYNFIKRALNIRDSKIFIHCHKGISRSSSVAIYYVMKHFNLTYDRAYIYVKNRRDKIQPNIWYRNQLRWLSDRRLK